jgi:hypothetical protein
MGPLAGTVPKDTIPLSPYGNLFTPAGLAAQCTVQSGPSQVAVNRATGAVTITYPPSVSPPSSQTVTIGSPTFDALTNWWNASGHPGQSTFAEVNNEVFPGTPLGSAPASVTGNVLTVNAAGIFTGAHQSIVVSVEDANRCYSMSPAVPFSVLPTQAVPGVVSVATPAPAAPSRLPLVLGLLAGVVVVGAGTVGGVLYFVGRPPQKPRCEAEQQALSAAEARLAASSAALDEWETVWGATYSPESSHVSDWPVPPAMQKVFDDYSYKGPHERFQMEKFLKAIVDRNRASASAAKEALDTCLGMFNPAPPPATSPEGEAADRVELG